MPKINKRNGFSRFREVVRKTGASVVGPKEISAPPGAPLPASYHFVTVRFLSLYRSAREKRPFPSFSHTVTSSRAPMTKSGQPSPLTSPTASAPLGRNRIP